MELPLIPFILDKIGSMRRHYQASDDIYNNIRNNDGLERKQQQRRLQEPHDGSQVRQADPPTGLSPSSVAPTMHAAKRRRTSDISSTQAFSYERSKSFEERNEERSAFSRPKSRDIIEASTASNDRNDEEKIPSKDPEESSDSAMQRPVASMPMSSSETTTASSAQPHLSPMRYYHQRRYAETIRDKPDAPPLQYPYAGGAAHPVPPDPYGYSYPYYHPNQYPRPDPPSARGQPQFPYFQDYRIQQQQFPSNMMPPVAGYMQHPPYPSDYYAAHGPAHRSYSAKDPPEAIINATEEKKARRQGTANDSMHLLSTSVGEDDERKPPARSSSRLKESSLRGSEKKSASAHNEMQDIYAPLPFNEVRTLMQSSMKTPSPPSPSTRFAASVSSNLDPFANTLDARGAQLPQHSPVVSTSTKRGRGQNPERTPIRQSYSASSAASAASASRHDRLSESSSKRGNSWDRRFNELVSCLPVWFAFYLCILQI